MGPLPAYAELVGIAVPSPSCSGLPSLRWPRIRLQAGPVGGHLLSMRYEWLQVATWTRRTDQYSSRINEGNSDRSIITAKPLQFKAGTTPVPILPAWVLSGAPLTHTWQVERSHDRTSHIAVWECTSGCFEWHYSSDETVVVVAGEVFITNEKGEEQRLGPRRCGSFPWRNFLCV